MYSVLTLIYTLTKRCIYNSKDEVTIDFRRAVIAIKKCEVIERNAAIAKQVIQKHADKWGVLYTHFRD